jgi:hypothetical protein
MAPAQPQLQLRGAVVRHQPGLADGLVLPGLEELRQPHEQRAARYQFAVSGPGERAQVVEVGPATAVVAHDPGDQRQLAWLEPR